MNSSTELKAHPNLYDLNTFVTMCEASDDREIKSMYEQFVEQCGDPRDLVDKYIEDSKKQWTCGMYFLGGQVKVSPDQDLSESLITDVKTKMGKAKARRQSW